MAITDESDLKSREPSLRRTTFWKCRRMIVGPWVNQPEEYEGYNGFVGWTGITRLRSGRWVLTFTSGYWHASVPWTEEIRKDPAKQSPIRGMAQDRLAGYPGAPRRAGAHHVFRRRRAALDKPGTLSTRPRMTATPPSWKPRTGPGCAPFHLRAARKVESCYMHSTDAGKTWSEPKKLSSESSGGFGNGSAILLKDGTILCSVGGQERATAAGTCLSCGREITAAPFICFPQSKSTAAPDPRNPRWRNFPTAGSLSSLGARDRSAGLKTRGKHGVNQNTSAWISTTRIL